MANHENKARSSRGEVVDFDLLRVKSKMEERNKPDSAVLREKYIDIRRRRNPRRNVADLVDEQRQNQDDAREKIRKSKENTAAAPTPTETVEAEVVSEPVAKKSKKIAKRNSTED